MACFSDMEFNDTKEIMLRYTEKALWLSLLAGLLLYYPGKLLYHFVTGYIAVFVVKLEIFEGVPGIKELFFIQSLSALILGALSILCAWHLFRKSKKTRVMVVTFLLLELFCLLMDPVWFRLSGFPMEYYDSQLYERLVLLLEPVGAVLLFSFYFYISARVEAMTDRAFRS